MNWLARLEIDAETAHAEGILDNYAWHKRLWEGCFPDDPNAKRDFLTRIDQMEGAFRLWVLAKRKPVRPGWCPPDGFALKEIAASFLSHRYYAFDLWANPVKTIVQRGPNGETLLRSDGKRKNGKRVPLVKPEELQAWIVHKGRVRCRDKDTGLDVPGGFRVVEEKSFSQERPSRLPRRRSVSRNPGSNRSCEVCRNISVWYWQRQGLWFWSAAACTSQPVNTTNL
jgi:CRISPR system Cascade subunit CasE